ncbi:MAG: zinc metallopeptidase [Bdellovibrionales bacterium]|nr:zinc metallopeptidase [Bdellovibrionales bacterium]
MFFDPMYLVFILPAILLAGYAQLKVRSTYAQASQYSPRSGMSGAEAASQILRAYGLHRVGIELSEGQLSDHYDPREKVLRLSPDVYRGRSLAALGIAAHEAGHAIQDAKHYAPLVARNAIVPMASFGSSASWIMLMAGLMINSFNLVLFGIVLFSLVVIFQLINLPVEYDASSRAKEVLVSKGLISPDELPIVKNVLSAAALTYVAATLTSILTLLYYLVRFGVIGGRRED